MALLLRQLPPGLVRLGVQGELRRRLKLGLELHRLGLRLQFGGYPLSRHRRERPLRLVAHVREGWMERHVSALLHGDHRVGLRARKGGRVQSRIYVYRGKEASVGIRRDGELTSHLPLRKAPTPVMLASY